MIEEAIKFVLPQPWAGEMFEIDEVGSVNYLVGPNGSGKSRFAIGLLGQLQNRGRGARLLGTDRLREMADPGRAGRYWGDNFEGGYAKSLFDQLRAAGAEGSGIDTVLLLEDRMDLRIRIEGTLGHLFGRDVELEWDSGNLVPKAVRRETGQSYRLDRDECHGIKELFVLLTHLYDHEHGYLIIDEPELNLHPQYQAFFMQEVRKVAGNPAEDANRKVVFLITHSPFILDLRRMDDLKSVISFDLGYSVPRQVGRHSPEVSSAVASSGRLNAHHKQLFFSDNPVFVEGHHDAMMVEALMEARGASAAAAGSCVIDCGGVGEVNHYLELCRSLGKDAHFVYDLDSMFHGRLRRCLSRDDHVGGLLAAAGVGPDFAKYLGHLDQRLTDMIDSLVAESLGGPLAGLERLFLEFGKGTRAQWAQDRLAKARAVVMTAIDRYRDEVVAVAGRSAVEDIEGRWQLVLKTLAEKNIHVLSGGPIERYLPSFGGDLFDPTAEAKRNAVENELEELQRIQECATSLREAALASRYGGLYDVVDRLPAKTEVDFDGTLRTHLSDYVHDLQKTIKANPEWTVQRIDAQMRGRPLAKSGVVSLDELQIAADGRFEARLVLSELLGRGPRTLVVDSDTTIGNMRPFTQPEAEGSVT
ncbi:MAG: AAA family ATPase [Gammaproteobacteria bacterium]|nr:AAA family ATPase [Gammaproteobacteria bacterium]